MAKAEQKAGSLTRQQHHQQHQCLSEGAALTLLLSLLAFWISLPASCLIGRFPSSSCSTTLSTGFLDLSTGLLILSTDLFTFHPAFCSNYKIKRQFCKK